MSDYAKVAEALAQGAEPRMLCETCPWDRFCISPPSMSREDIERQMEEAKAKDEEHATQARAEGKDPGIGMGSLITILAVAGRDSQASVCPVLVARMRSSDGRRIVDGVRAQMKAWDDSQVGEGVAGDAV